MTTAPEVEGTLADLVRIPSVTPWLIADGEGEAAVAQYLASRLEQLPGVKVALEEVTAGRPNVIARLGDASSGPRLWLNAHSDTVGYANWRERALVPETSGDRLVGVGAADDKAGCATALLAVESLVARGVRLQGQLVAAFTVDEEGVSIGTEDLLRRHRDEMDACLVLEPDGLDHVIVEHQGFGWIDVIVHGRAAHGSAPDVGVDAIQHMAEVIRRLGELDRGGFGHGQGGPSGRTVFHTGTIQGGTDYATYPSRCVLGIEIGTQPGETLANRVAEIEQIFDQIRERTPAVRGEVDVKLDRDPFKAEGHERLGDALAAASASVIGLQPAQLGMNAWADSGLTQGAGVPTLLYGPAGGNFHAPDEWASLSEVGQAAEIVAETAVRFCDRR
jgi:succinyl-diaminopimelate desuccinylase